ncbi:T9SS type A sorting domain-containing protein [Hymenobacter psychrotolerans]|uniref:Por secretion system C-terminal sorting domain-containing protein n=1 Tax=Hymenobacter psychrotolerans DSM 18569 TaxID=1121959 RepID=A0A1M6PU81_9BACT|nr:T9SS type A sorting domain-containing protein [Hymenobacter psychrotolerans]SHK11495.1 Por secretion system C-terminal sorting domain-containing protein [Hymenobacter psychrotolerans DSM 18569]
MNVLSKMLRLQDGGLLLPASADTTLTPNVYTGRPFLRKVNAQLQPVWSYVYRGGLPRQYFQFIRMLELQDGSVLALAAEELPRPPVATYQLHHISASGRLLRLYPITTALCDAFQLATLIADPGGRAVYVAGGCQSPGNTGAYAARIDLSPSLPLLLAATPAQLTAAAPLTFELFPNPASTTATVRYQLPAGTAAALHLTDATGRLVRRLTLRGGSSGGEVVVPLAGLAPGLYAATLLTPDGRPLATRRLAVVAE